MGTLAGFIFLGSKITENSECSHEIKRPLLLGREAMANLNSTLKNGNITLATNVYTLKTMVFSRSLVQMWDWIIKKAEHWQINAFELWCWIRLSRVPWTARRSNQSILEEVNPKYSLEGLMLKLTLQYSGHGMQRATHWKRPWCWEWLKMGGEGGDRGWDGWLASPTGWTWV